MELSFLRPKLAQLERSMKLSENEINCLQEQLTGKNVSLEEAVRELDSLRSQRGSEGDENIRKQKNIEELHIQV